MSERWVISELDLMLRRLYVVEENNFYWELLKHWRGGE